MNRYVNKGEVKIKLLLKLKGVNLNIWAVSVDRGGVKIK